MTGNGFIIVNIKIVVEAASRMWRGMEIHRYTA